MKIELYSEQDSGTHCMLLLGKCCDQWHVKVMYRSFALHLVVLVRGITADARIIRTLRVFPIESYSKKVMQN